MHVQIPERAFGPKPLLPFSVDQLMQNAYRRAERYAIMLNAELWDRVFAVADEPAKVGSSFPVSAHRAREMRRDRMYWDLRTWHGFDADTARRWADAVCEALP